MIHRIHVLLVAIDSIKCATAIELSSIHNLYTYEHRLEKEAANARWSSMEFLARVSRLHAKFTRARFYLGQGREKSRIVPSVGRVCYRIYALGRAERETAV